MDLRFKYTVVSGQLSDASVKRNKLERRTLTLLNVT